MTKIQKIFRLRIDSISMIARRAEFCKKVLYECVIMKVVVSTNETFAPFQDWGFNRHQGHKQDVCALPILKKRWILIVRQTFLLQFVLIVLSTNEILRQAQYRLFALFQFWKRCGKKY